MLFHWRNLLYAITRSIKKYKHADYLLPASQWSRETYDNAIHSSHPTVYYEFSEDPQKWLLPTMTVYVPTNSDVIQEITHIGNDAILSGNLLLHL